MPEEREAESSEESGAEDASGEVLLDRLAEGVEGMAARLRELETLERARRSGSVWQGVVLAAILVLLGLNLLAHMMSIKAARARAPIDRLRNDLVRIVHEEKARGIRVEYYVYPPMELTRTERHEESGAEYREYFISDEKLEKLFRLVPEVEEQEKDEKGGGKNAPPTASD